MSKFKVGNEIVCIKSPPCGAEVGFKAIVDDGYCYETPSGERKAVFNDYWELAKPKWTIYNNTLPWSDLSDKQKGKMLLADHNGKSFGGTHKTVFNNPCHPYQAKPEPTMAELFLADWGDIAGVEMDGYFNFAGKIIAKGWVKKC
jgi:hypothetical protein